MNKCIKNMSNDLIKEALTIVSSASHLSQLTYKNVLISIKDKIDQELADVDLNMKEKSIGLELYKKCNINPIIKKWCDDVVIITDEMDIANYYKHSEKVYKIGLFKFTIIIDGDIEESSYDVSVTFPKGSCLLAFCEDCCVLGNNMKSIDLFYAQCEIDDDFFDIGVNREEFYNFITNALCTIEPCIV